MDIAKQIQQKIKRKELSSDSDEMKEIQSVMFNMGLIQDFSSQVTKYFTVNNCLQRPRGQELLCGVGKGN